MGYCVAYNEATYKLGKTTRNILTRVDEYPKGTEIIVALRVENCHQMENKLKKKFNKLFVQRKDLGIEYYSGDVIKMQDVIIRAVSDSFLRKDAETQKEIVSGNLVKLKTQQIDLLSEMPSLLKPEVHTINSCDDDNMDTTDDIADNSYNIPNVTSVNITVNNINTHKTDEPVFKKTIETFCRSIYDTRPKWYSENKMVDINIIADAYREYFGGNKITSAISADLKSKLFNAGTRRNGATLKKLVPYEHLIKIANNVL